MYLYLMGFEQAKVQGIYSRRHKVQINLLCHMIKWLRLYFIYCLSAK